MYWNLTIPVKAAAILRYKAAIFIIAHLRDFDVVVVVTNTYVLMVGVGGIICSTIKYANEYSFGLSCFAFDFQVTYF